MHQNQGAARPSQGPIAPVITDAPQDVRARIKYVVRGQKATFYAGDRERSHWPGEEHEVTVHDMRPHRAGFSLEGNGFVALDEASTVPDPAGEAGRGAAYGRECEALVARLTGASKVISFGMIVRTSAPGTHGHNQPAFGAHVDYGARTVADFTRQILPPAEAEARLAGRHMLINVWRPLARVESTPFALCDARTVHRADLFDSEIVGGLGGLDFSLWGYNLAHRPDHRWYWLPQMGPDQVFAFKLFDSDAKAVQFTAHTAFADPAAPADAAPRQSVEIRTIAFFDRGFST